jgi:agmatine deiminase
VVIQTCEEPGHPDVERMAANEAVLRAARDARGRALDIVQLPYYPHADAGGHPVTVSCVNAYVANGGVVVPCAGGDEFDAPARERLAEARRGRDVVGIDARVIAHGGGGVHCITQPVPAV